MNHSGRSVRTLQQPAVSVPFMSEEEYFSRVGETYSTAAKDIYGEYGI